MPGAIDPQSGTYVYASDDARSPMHTVLNLLASTVRVALISARQRLTDLEGRFAAMDDATPWAALPLNTTNYEGTNLDSIGPIPATALQYKRLGTTVSIQGAVNTKVVPSNWTVLGTLPVGMRPASPTQFGYIFTHYSDMYRGIVETNGIMRIGQAPPNVGADLTVMPFTLSTV